MANEIGINEGSYARLESGLIALSYEYLARIASIFNMSVIDVITYPDVYVKRTDGNAPSERISVTFEVDPSEKEYLLRLVQNKK